MDYEEPRANDAPGPEMAPEWLKGHAQDVDRTGAPSVNESSFDQHSFDASGCSWNVQGFSYDHRDTQAHTLWEEVEEKHRGNTGLGNLSYQPWNPLSQWREEVAVHDNFTTPSYRPCSPGPSSTSHTELKGPADLPSMAKRSFYDSKQDNSIAVVCPTCRTKFSGGNRKGNFIRHMRAKHNAPDCTGRDRYRKLTYAILLTWAQLACTVPLHSYDHCHGDVTCRPPIVSSSVLSGLPPLFDFLIHLTTNEFVLSALAYGAAAMYQYHINVGDRFQQLCLLVGVATGFLLSLALSPGLDEQRAMTSTMAIAITIALLPSALGHGLYAIFSSKDNCEETVADEEEKKIGGNEV